MKLLKSIKTIILSSWSLSIIPTLLAMFLMPKLSSEYTLLIEGAGKSEENRIYADLDYDNISESLNFEVNAPYSFVSVRDYEGKYFDQWNMYGLLDTELAPVFIGNFDDDKFKEIYALTHNHDSLYFNINEFFESSGTRYERQFLTKIAFKDGSVLSHLKPIGLYDVNEDGFKEFYFVITSGYILQPRKIYSYDIVNKKLSSSQFTGEIPMPAGMQDVDDDGRPEFFGSMSSSGNYPSNVPYTDSSTWLMVFNDKLEFEFPPVEFPGFANSLEISGYKYEDFRGYVLLLTKGNRDSTVMESSIMLYSADGKFIRKRQIKDFSVFSKFYLFLKSDLNSDRIYVLGSEFTELDYKFNIVQQVSLPFETPTKSYLVDINSDGKNEYLVYSDREQKLAVFNSELKLLNVRDFSISISNTWEFSPYITEKNDNKLFLRSGNDKYFISLVRNDFFYLGYFIIPSIYLFFSLFILFIKKNTIRQIEQRETMKRKLLTLQLQGIKSQLDPHFTFNALNSVASLVYMNDRQSAYDYLNKFTHLIRRLLNDAERIYRSLNEELEFVTTYLDLEKLRFGDKFNYEISIGDGVMGNVLVPKLVLQTFAENAIKHGIMPREEGGMLKISVKKESEYLILTVEDNGVGRAEAAGHSSSTGKGLKLTDEFYEILNKVLKKPLKFLITDLNDNTGSPAGTRVEVWVPADLLHP